MSAKETFNEKSSKRMEDINKVNRHGTNKLIEAIEKRQHVLVEVMLEQGADLDFRTGDQSKFSSITHTVPYSKGSTPLHAACLHGSPVIFELLLDKGVDVNAKNEAGHTPLDYALLSYAYYKTEYEKKAESKFTLQRSVEKALERVEDYISVIKKMAEAGGKTGLFELPSEFQTEQPAPAHKNTIAPPGM